MHSTYTYDVMLHISIKSWPCYTWSTSTSYLTSATGTQLTTISTTSHSSDQIRVILHVRCRARPRPRGALGAHRALQKRRQGLRGHGTAVNRSPAIIVRLIPAFHGAAKQVCLNYLGRRRRPGSSRCPERTGKRIRLRGHAFFNLKCGDVQLTGAGRWGGEVSL
jgi:hypothetical protein